MVLQPFLFPSPGRKHFLILFDLFWKVFFRTTSLLRYCMWTSNFIDDMHLSFWSHFIWNMFLLQVPGLALSNSQKMRSTHGITSAHCKQLFFSPSQVVACSLSHAT